MNLESMHFLRPEWLLALTLLIPILGLAWRRREAGGWERICEPHLLRHILADAGGKRGRWPLVAFALGWVGACVALAGPTWERLPQLSFEDPSRTVFVLGLAPSMDARDVAPSRMARARHKLQDAVDQLGGGSAALVVYREEAFAATPLTDDLKVLRELTPLLETNLAPGRRVLPARGIEAATQLLEPAGLNGAHIVLVTDGADDAPKATRAAAAAAAARGARVSVLGIAGTSPPLEEIAAAGHGSFAALTADDRDLAQILAARDPGFGAALSKSERQADAWLDMGVWLVWIPLLLAPLAFRKGWATALLALLCLQGTARPAEAGVFDWLQRQDQRAAREFAEEHYEEAAAAFEDPAWRAAARYRAGDFEAAAAELASRTDARSSYNRGNALAHAGKLKEALAAYETALAAEPEDADARFNRDLVKRLLEQQKPPSSDSDDASKPGDSRDGQAEQSPSQESASADSSKASPEASAENGSDTAREADPEQSANGAADAAPEASANDESGAAQNSSAHDSATQGSEDSPGPEGKAAGTATADPDTQDSPPQADANRSEGASGSEAGDAARAGASSEPPGERAQAGNDLPPASGAGRVPMTPEERQAARWMARLPDDPGGLLREKIRRDYLRKLVARRQGDLP